MPFSDTTYNLRIELDTKNCTLSPGEIEKLERGLAPLRKPVEKFPVSDLYITIYAHPRSQAYRVKTALVLPGRTITTGDLDEQLYGCFERCIRKLANRVHAYEADLSAEPDMRKHQKGTRQDVVADQEPDPASFEEAVRDGDYAAFRTAASVYEEPLRKRIGRWIQRYPEIEEALGDELTLEDLVEEVMLNAYERFDVRPPNVRFGDWLEELIDPSVKPLVANPEEELENIRFAHTLRET